MCIPGPSFSQALLWFSGFSLGIDKPVIIFDLTYTVLYLVVYLGDYLIQIWPVQKGSIHLNV